MLAAANDVGGDCDKSTAILSKAFERMTAVIAAVSACKKPAQEDLGALAGPVGECIMEADGLTGGRRGAMFNHQKAIAEFLQALTWVVYTGKDCGMSLPLPHVDEVWGAAEFYVNKILVAERNKDSGKPHVAWCKALKELAMALKAYVKKYHATGPSWNMQGVDLKSYKPAGGIASAAASPPPPPPAGGPPPPPPPPPAGSLTKERPAGGAAGPKGGMSAVFSELNQGSAVTAGLKKVTADMKTKNRADRSGKVPDGPAKKAVPAAKSKAAAPAARPPKLELSQGRKWLVEHQVDNKAIVIDNCSPVMSVYVYNCKGSVIQIKGKVNNIVLDKCHKTGIVFTDVVASFEAVNCQSVQVQTTGKCPTFAVDKTDGFHLYLSEHCLDASITTAKSSEMNVTVPAQKENDDPVEIPIPEQFITTYKTGKLVTLAVEHAG